MTEHQAHPIDRDPTQPVEVQRYGQAPYRDPYRAPAPDTWATRPPDEARPARRLGAGPTIAIAIVAGIVSGSLSAAGVSTLLGQRTPESVTPDNPATTVTDVTIDESSAVISAVEKVAPAVVTIQTSTAAASTASTRSPTWRS
jgi:hypothetical protein